MSTKGKTLSSTTRGKMARSHTKHTQAHLIEQARAYLQSITDDAGVLLAVPSVVSFCLHAGISRTRLYELLPTMPELANIMETIDMLQEQYALNAGFSGKSPIFSIFMLKSKHSYHDQPQQLTQNNTFNISPDLLADALQLMNQNKPSK